jgi:hypothetical protein
MDSAKHVRTEVVAREEPICRAAAIRAWRRFDIHRADARDGVAVFVFGDFLKVRAHGISACANLIAFSFPRRGRQAVAAWPNYQAWIADMCNMFRPHVG